MHKAGSSQWGSKRNDLLGVEKHLFAFPKQIPGTKENNFLPTLANGPGCAERDREGTSGCQGHRPRLDRGRGWLVAVDGVLVSQDHSWGSPRNRISSWEEGSRGTESLKATRQGCIFTKQDPKQLPALHPDSSPGSATLSTE